MGSWMKPKSPLARDSHAGGGVGVEGSGRDAGELNDPVSMLLGAAERLTINCPVAGFLSHDPDT